MPYYKHLDQRDIAEAVAALDGRSRGRGRIAELQHRMPNGDVPRWQYTK